MSFEIYKIKQSVIRIRSARKEEKQELAKLAYKCYYNRFFNEEVTSVKGGSLRMYPELIPDDKLDLGQNLASFQNYWDKAFEDEKFRCFVAEEAGKEGSKIVGFVKGSFTDIECGDEKTGELGSLYIDPECQCGKMGSLLTQKYAKELSKEGFTQMITKCYSRNNSQFFFSKMGAKFLTKCQIPNSYRKGNEEEGTSFIPGDIMAWSKKSMKALISSNVLSLGKGENVLGQMSNKVMFKKDMINGRS